MKITDPALALPFRRDLVPASFRDAQFHIETSSKQGGRRIALHEFPKKELPYAEDMGRHAFRFVVRAYCITYPFNFSQPLLWHDYRVARDLLQSRLDDGIPGQLTIPTLKPTGVGSATQMPMPIYATCERYGMTEEDRAGGFVVFDIAFVEIGVPPNRPVPNNRINTISQATAVVTTVINRTIAPGLVIPPGAL
jgi:hypothetical protein